MKIGDYVIETNYGTQGIINNSYEDWQDYKNKTNFVTICPNIQEYDHIELMINDPRDKWLELQNIPFTKDQLNEKWFSVFTINGGEIVSCESRLKIDNNMA